VLSTLSTFLRALVSFLLDLLAPATCAACEARLRRRAVLCAACASAVEPADPLPASGAVPAIVAFAMFGGPIAEALRKLKYADRADLARPLGELGRRAAREEGLSADLVIPVPLHPARLAERGYNQAALLAAEIAREVRAPLHARALVRLRHTPQQARLDRAARLANVEGAFRARSPSRVRGRRVLLVDDVCTTGATLAACAEALVAAGAIEVRAIVIARA
jgi:ComF family protein